MYPHLCTLKGQRWRQSPRCYYRGGNVWVLWFPFLPFHWFRETSTGSTRPQLPPTSEATGSRAGNLQQDCPPQRAGRECFSAARYMVKILELDQMQDEITALPGTRYVTKRESPDLYPLFLICEVEMTAIPTPRGRVNKALCSGPGIAQKLHQCYLLLVSLRRHQRPRGEAEGKTRALRTLPPSPPSKKPTGLGHHCLGTFKVPEPGSDTNSHMCLLSQTMFNGYIMVSPLGTAQAGGGGRHRTHETHSC